MDQNHLEVKLNISSSSETSLGNEKDDCFERFRKTSSAKIEKIETWMKAIQDSLTEMKSDLVCCEKFGKTVSQLEAEVQYLKRTSPLTVTDVKELKGTIQSRALRLKAIKAELISVLDYFEGLEKRYNAQCEEISKLVAAYPNIVQPV